ncbi:MAG: hypothetical protein BGO41_12090 [Clostridiales bacterium 38-18]|nr:MAG: hypothetical protein BGO41_12090 [Clostridiales bacterium 38-18]
MGKISYNILSFNYVKFLLSVKSNIISNKSNINKSEKINYNEQRFKNSNFGNIYIGKDFYNYAFGDNSLNTIFDISNNFDFNNDYYVIDFKYITGCEDRTIINFLDDNRDIIFLNLREMDGVFLNQICTKLLSENQNYKLYDINGNEVNYFTQTTDNNNLISDGNIKNIVEDETLSIEFTNDIDSLVIVSDISKTITYTDIEYIRDLIPKFLLEKNEEIIKDLVIVDEWYYVDSSSIWVKPYVDIKNIFSKIDIYIFLIYELVEKIYDFILIEKVSKLKLIATSQQGALITDLVSKILDIDMLFFNTVGPKFGISQENDYLKELSNYNFISISDFICLGTELKILNAILLLTNSNLIKSFTFSSALDLNEGKISKKISSVIDVKETTIKYQISLIKGE